MKNSVIFLPAAKSFTFMAIGVLGLLTVVVLNKLAFTEISLFGEGTPRLNLDYILLSILIAISTLCIFYSIVFWRSDRSSIVQNEHPTFGRFEQQAIAISLLSTVIFLFLFLFRPTTFNRLSLEDGAIEWASAILLFVTSAALVASFLKLRKTMGETILKVIAIFFATVFFVMGMEEISWMQRVFGLESSQHFEGNVQGELNLHNFATGSIEIAYYFGAFALTVFIPFMRKKNVFYQDNNLFLLIPRPWIIYVGAVACAYNFDMWNIFPMQIAFFSTCFILFYMMITHRSKTTAVISGIALVNVILTQGAFLLITDRYARGWEVTEYREFLMPLAFLAYSLDVLMQISKKQTDLLTTQSLHHTQSPTMKT